MTQPTDGGPAFPSIGEGYSVADALLAEREKAAEAEGGGDA